MTPEFHELADNAIASLTALAEHLREVQADDGPNQRERQGRFEYYATRVETERDRLVQIKAQIEAV